MVELYRARLSCHRIHVTLYIFGCTFASCERGARTEFRLFLEARPCLCCLLARFAIELLTTTMKTSSSVRAAQEREGTLAREGSARTRRGKVRARVELAGTDVLRVRARSAALGDIRALRESRGRISISAAAGAAFSTGDRAQRGFEQGRPLLCSLPWLSPRSPLLCARVDRLAQAYPPALPRCTRLSPLRAWPSSPSPRPSTRRTPRRRSTSPTATTSSRAQSRTRSGGRPRVRSRPTGAQERSSACAGPGRATLRASLVPSFSISPKARSANVYRSVRAARWERRATCRARRSSSTSPPSRAPRPPPRQRGIASRSPRRLLQTRGARPSCARCRTTRTWTLTSRCVHLSPPRPALAREAELIRPRQAFPEQEPYRFPNYVSNQAGGPSFKAKRQVNGCGPPPPSTTVAPPSSTTTTSAPSTTTTAEVTPRQRNECVAAFLARLVEPSSPDLLFAQALHMARRRRRADLAIPVEDVAGVDLDELQLPPRLADPAARRLRRRCRDARLPRCVPFRPLLLEVSPASRSSLRRAALFSQMARSSSPTRSATASRARRTSRASSASPLLSLLRSPRFLLHARCTELTLRYTLAAPGSTRKSGTSTSPRSCPARAPPFARPSSPPPPSSPTELSC